MTASEAGLRGDISPLVAKSHEVARVLKLLANQKRLLIMCRLAECGECSVSELADAVELGQSALSQHLARLRAEDLVSFRRESQTIYYSLADSQLKRLLMALKEIYCPGL